MPMPAVSAFLVLPCLVVPHLVVPWLVAPFVLFLMGMTHHSRLLR